MLRRAASVSGKTIEQLYDPETPLRYLFALEHTALLAEGHTCQFVTGKSWTCGGVEDVLAFLKE